MSSHLLIFLKTQARCESVHVFKSVRNSQRNNLYIKLMCATLIRKKYSTTQQQKTLLNQEKSAYLSENDEVGAPCGIRLTPADVPDANSIRNRSEHKPGDMKRSDGEESKHSDSTADWGVAGTKHLSQRHFGDALLLANRSSPVGEYERNKRRLVTLEPAGRKRATVDFQE